MKAFVYGVRQEMQNKFAEAVSLNESAVISIDMYTRHLSPDGLGPCLAPRCLEIIEPVDKRACNSPPVYAAKDRRGILGQRLQ